MNDVETPLNTCCRRISLVAVIGLLRHAIQSTCTLAERRRDADRACCSAARYESRNPRQRFGVYIVEFHDKSGLTDDNASRLLQLNELPSKYDLTLVLNTSKITDVSIPILAKLTSTDLIIAEDSGITDSGIVEWLRCFRKREFPPANAPYRSAANQAMQPSRGAERFDNGRSFAATG